MKNELTAGAVGAGGAAVVLTNIKPQDAIDWTDWAVHLIQTGGMALVVLVLLLALIGVIYYYERVRIPEKNGCLNEARDKWEARENEYEGKIEELNDAALKYRDQILDRMEKIITDGAAAQAKLAVVLQEVQVALAASKKEKGRDSGTS